MDKLSVEDFGCQADRNSIADVLALSELGKQRFCVYNKLFYKDQPVPIGVLVHDAELAEMIVAFERLLKAQDAISYWDFAKINLNFVEGIVHRINHHWHWLWVDRDGCRGWYHTQEYRAKMSADIGIVVDEYGNHLRVTEVFKESVKVILG